MKIPFWQSFLVLIGFLVLCGLGTWQVSRLQWKNTIIQKIDAAYETPQNLTFDSSADFLYGTVDGQLQTDKSILIGPRALKDKMGFYLHIPLKTRDGKILFINAGWVDEAWKNTRPTNRQVSVRGLMRKPDYSKHSSKNSPANNLWFTANLNEMAQNKNLKDVYPMVLYADQITPPLEYVIQNAQKWYPRNEHLQYAIFWYVMAGVLAIVFVFYRRMSRRQKL